MEGNERTYETRPSKIVEDVTVKDIITYINFQEGRVSILGNQQSQR